MKKQYFTIALAITTSALLSSCDMFQKEDGTHATKATSKPIPVSASINDLKWLVGSWESVSLEEKSFENWKEVSETTLLGESGTIKGSDTVISETISIEQRGNELFYIPTVKDQNNGEPVSFKLSQASNGTFVFENAAHDFPQKITYTQKAPNILLAKISGKLNGKDHAVLFPMNKVQ